MYHFLSCPVAFAGLPGNSLDANFTLTALKQECRFCQGTGKKEEVAENTRWFLLVLSWFYYVSSTCSFLTVSLCSLSHYCYLKRLYFLLEIHKERSINFFSFLAMGEFYHLLLCHGASLHRHHSKGSSILPISWVTLLHL